MSLKSGWCLSGQHTACRMVDHPKFPCRCNCPPASHGTEAGRAELGMSDQMREVADRYIVPPKK